MGDVFDISGPQRLVAGGVWFLVLMILSGVFWLLMSVVISRVYGPEGYGIYSAAFSVFNFAWAFIFGGFFEGFIKYGSEQVTKEGWKLKSYFSTVFAFMTILGILMLIVFSALAFYIDGFISHVIFLSISLAFLLSGTKDALSSIIGSFQKSNYLSIIQSSRSIVVFIAGIVYILAGFPPYVLPTLIIVGTLWQLVLSIYLLRTRMKKILPFNVNDIFKSDRMNIKMDIVKLANIFKFGIFISLGIISFNVMKSLDIVVLTFFFDYGGVGVYSAADATASILFYMTSFSLPIIPAIAEAYSKKDKRLLKEYGRIAIKYPVMIGVPLVLIVFSLAEPLVLSIYGEAFTGAILPLRILVFGTFMLMLGYTLNSILIGVGKAKKAGTLMMIAAFQYIISLFILVRFLGFTGAALSLTFTGLTSMLLIPYHIKKDIGISIYQGLYKVAVSGLAMLIVLHLIPKTEFIFAVAGIICGVSVFIISLRLTGYLTDEDLDMVKSIESSFKD